MNFASDISIRRTIKPGDLGAIIQMHGNIYAAEYGFDETFEAYVAGPLAEFVCRRDPRERLWIAEIDNRIIGCVAIVSAPHGERRSSLETTAAPEDSQLRWFLVYPSARGKGLGRRLLNEAIEFAKSCGCRSIFLWTVDSLTAAAKLYSSVGFQLVEQSPTRQWGVDVVEHKYEMVL